MTKRFFGQANRPHLDEQFSEAEQLWVFGLFTKVVVQVQTEDELVAVYEAAKGAGLETNLVEDSGLTEFAGAKTKTAVGIGPDFAERIDPVTKHLKLY